MRTAPSFRGGRPSVKPPTAKPPGPGPLTAIAGGRQSVPPKATMGGGPQPMAQPPASKTTSMMAPAKPQTTRMYADGGMGMPGPVGGAPMVDPTEGQQAPGEAGPAADMPPMPAIEPTAVNYHDDEHKCSLCSYQTGNQCSVLQMEVSPVGGCTAFKGGAEPDADDMGAGGDQGNQPGEDDNNTGAGTTASY